MARKNFKRGNPAEIEYTSPAQQFLQTEPETSEKQAEATEKKSARLNLHLYPDIKEGLQAIAAARGISVMDLVNQIMREYTTAAADEIEAYKELQEKFAQLKKGGKI